MVIVKQLAAKLQVKLAFCRFNALYNMSLLLFNIVRVVKADLPHLCLPIQFAVTAAYPQNKGLCTVNSAKGPISNSDNSIRIPF
ncbi:hypothetical protein SDC9_207964 [bioreactor metagenome]|uniref:Uncharacterized protein n=1 Tax=bioreactor metagenome TaxID=1076179 RepID=A0A645JBW3_9ZZZZ